MADQVVYMDGFPRHERKRPGDEQGRPESTVSDPFRYSIDLAVMESLTPMD